MGLRGPVVLTVSRRTDLVRWYPGVLCARLESQYPPERVHTVLIMTKHPSAVLEPAVRRVLAGYAQTVVHVTITGLGGTPVEPGVPAAEAALAELPRLVEFAGNAARVVLRIDPLISLGHGAREYRNSHLVGGLAAAAVAAGVRRVIASVAQPYAKVLRRCRTEGFELRPLFAGDRELLIRQAETAVTAAGGSLQWCCAEGTGASACVDAALLTSLHPTGLQARTDRAGGQRAACGCTHAVDLGWYASHPCYSGCLYCYANPRRPDPRAYESAGPGPVSPKT